MNFEYQREVAKILDKATRKEGTLRKFIYSSKLKVGFNFEKIIKNYKIKKFFNYKNKIIPS